MARADYEFDQLARKVQQDAAKLGAHSLLLEVAINLLLKHDLLGELAHEMANAPMDERDKLQARINELEAENRMLNSELRKSEAKAVLCDGKKQHD